MALLLVVSSFKTAIVLLTEAVVAFEILICKQIKNNFIFKRTIMLLLHCVLLFIHIQNQLSLASIAYF